MIFGVAALAGFLAACAALYGRYRLLPSWLTGPEVCKLEAGGCQALFRTKEAALLGVPNSALGVAYYPLLALGVRLGWPKAALFAAATAALAITVWLARYLLANRLQCRICWVGHAANAVLWALLLRSMQH
ncbi:MAG: vitamin K epoxide reductase family protein [Elusimicrobia bacterium]|nr:vitamin K epoxide reductase family protein [Elusimicrobiota bacterium]